MKKNLIIINIINILMLFILFGTWMFMKSGIGTLIFFLIIWLLYVSILNYKLLVKDTDVLSNLKEADKRHLFQKEVNTLVKSIQSIEFYRDIFELDNVDGKIRDTYELLSRKAYENVSKAEIFISHYDYITRPRYDYLTNLVKNNVEISQKLNDLDELVIRVDADLANNTDISSVDDMLESLKEVLEDE